MARRRRDRWRELSQLVAEDDGLLTRVVGPWSLDKLWWWNRYVEITTTAMVGHPAWPAGVVYVDLFCGPGVSTLRESGDRCPGSPIIAASAPKAFRRILLCEENEDAASACRERIRRLNAEERTTVFCGDCNERIGEIAAEIPDGALTVAFVDPTGLHADFSTIETLTTNRQVDLLILFADRMDIVRNVELYEQQTDSNLDRVLGPDSDWRSRWQACDSTAPSDVARLFLDIYQDQLRRHLNYEYFGDEVIAKHQNVPLYRLLYASRHERGLDFWAKITSRERESDRLF